MGRLTMTDEGKTRVAHSLALFQPPPLALALVLVLALVRWDESSFRWLLMCLTGSVCVRVRVPG